MNYPFMIKRLIKRVLTWFFKQEYQTIYLKTVREADTILQADDIIHKHNGKEYVIYSDLQRAADDCPHNEPLHYHHDGCPACYLDECKVFTDQ